MGEKIQDYRELLQKLGIEELNAMQQEAYQAIAERPEVVLLSPTGTGKTLAFLLPLLDRLEPELQAVQALILTPSRELALQIEQVLRDMGSGFKVNAVYGGRSRYKDRQELQHPPAVLIGTPGRVADHFRRDPNLTAHIRTLVLDEFDKSLEVGFAEEMKAIIRALPALDKKVLTSATQKVDIPAFVGLQDPQTLIFQRQDQRLTLKTVVSPTRDKLETLGNLLGQLGQARGIIFCNFKDTIRFVSEYLQKKGIDHTAFYGGLEQIAREQALVQFRNGSHRLLLATDLAARGIDVPELDFIIHYQLPPRKEEFVHRNGRTARMHSEGIAYLLRHQEEYLPDFVEGASDLYLQESPPPPPTAWATLLLSGGRRDKISKGDVAGFLIKQGDLLADQVGLIELKQDCAFVAVPRQQARQLVNRLNNGRLKKKKVRVSLLP